MASHRRLQDAISPSSPLVTSTGWGKLRRLRQPLWLPTSGVHSEVPLDRIARVSWFSLPEQTDTGAGLARDRGKVRDPKSVNDARDGDLDDAPFKACGNVAATWLCFPHEDSSISVHTPRPYGVLAQPRCSAAARTGKHDADRDDRRRKGEELIRNFIVKSGEGRLLTGR